MQVIQGVTEVATACVETIEEGDTYTSLLDCANILNGGWRDRSTYLPFRRTDLLCF